MLERCEWARGDLIEYHDREWGVPAREDDYLFELLVLEAAQSGLSWEMVFRKRDAYRVAFDRFRVAKVAEYDARKLEELVHNAGIIRHRLKIAATVNNARQILKLQPQFGSFANYLWSFVDDKPIKNAWRSSGERPSNTPVSEALSRDLKKRGFKFVGATLCYAFMQAAGLVNDHKIDCFRYAEVS